MTIEEIKELNETCRKLFISFEDSVNSAINPEILADCDNSYDDLTRNLENTCEKIEEIQDFIIQQLKHSGKTLDLKQTKQIINCQVALWPLYRYQDKHCDDYINEVRVLNINLKLMSVKEKQMQIDQFLKSLGKEDDKT